jgi:membrane fusion protein, multidrug efflux system
LSFLRLLMWVAVSAVVVAGLYRPDISGPLLAQAQARAVVAWEQAIAWLKASGETEYAAYDDDDDDDEHAGNDDDDDDDDAEPALIVGGVPAVRLDEETQDLGGIETALLEAVSLVPEVALVGEVVDIQPLIDQRAGYREAYFRAQAADIRLDALRAEHRRLAALYSDDANVAQKTVQQAEAAWQAERAERNRLWDGLDTLRQRAARDWGPVLAGWAFERENAAFEALFHRHDTVILVHLPAALPMASGVAQAFVAADGERRFARPASHISAAPRGGRASPGEAHYFAAADTVLPAGTRVQLWLPQSVEPLAGRALPASAIVHALGRSWAYVQVDEEHFVRRAVDLSHPLPDGRYLIQALAADEAAAVTGAVVLYAEEFRSQVRDEDDD